MTRPIVVFDLETTGTDVAKDRIVSIALIKFESVGGPVVEMLTQTFNPERQMSPENVAIHGITNEAAAAARPFRDYASAIDIFMSGCDLAGFNLLDFDVPMLWEELHRSGVEWDQTDVNIVDVSNIFRKKEERTLSAAVRFYCGREHSAAHNALGDVRATAAVLAAQVARYPDLQGLDTAALAKFSRFDDRVDLAGKIVRDKDGDPAYAIGQSKGTKVRHDPGFGRWMLKQGFTEQTKRVVRQILGDSTPFFVPIKSDYAAHGTEGGK